MHYPLEKATCPEDACDGITKHGHCTHKRLAPSRFCSMHGGALTMKKLEKERMREYKVNQYMKRYAEFADSPQIRSLREEIGITRMSLEAIMEQVDSASKLLVYHPQILQTLMVVQKLVEAAQKLDEKNNLLLDRKILMTVVDGIIQRITNHVKDAAILDVLSTEIYDVITGTISRSNADGSTTT